jgi:L-alanine-DL-glutamate epimerase-like enolase superfamily enzyme
MRDVRFSVQDWPFIEPLFITGYSLDNCAVLHASISENGRHGHGEAVGVYYFSETGDSLLAQAQSVQAAVADGADREMLHTLLPSGGARNAIDCALWDLEAKLAGKSIWELTGIECKETITGNTVGIDTPENMAAKSRLANSPKIKVKLNNEIPVERIQAVCDARPDAEIIVDVNQGWTFDELTRFAPKFKELGVAMIEQPLPRGQDEILETYDSPITLCSDESCLDTGELEQASRRYQMINIKLDKTGGLTEALALAYQAKAAGLKVMVGNMGGTSLAMAPAYVVAQLCDLVDLDGALFLTKDREHSMSYEGGVVSGLTPELWG